MIKITFPDGSVREFAKGTTAFQIAESISPRLAADSLAASVNGATVDMMRPIEEDASVKFYKWEDEEGKHAFWHTSSHLLAEALEALHTECMAVYTINSFRNGIDYYRKETQRKFEFIETIVKK